MKKKLYGIIVEEEEEKKNLAITLHFRNNFNEKRKKKKKIIKTRNRRKIVTFHLNVLFGFFFSTFSCVYFTLSKTFSLLPSFFLPFRMFLVSSFPRLKFFFSHIYDFFLSFISLLPAAQFLFGISSFGNSLSFTRVYHYLPQI